MADAAYLSIGEVLGILLEEFPDVTISKIRFLESQGLIEPERTPSGYRKFYDNDVDLLRAILREQKDNFLPLKVIRDRIESGEIDQTGSHTLPRGIKNVDAALVKAADQQAKADGQVDVHTVPRDSVFRRTDLTPEVVSVGVAASASAPTSTITSIVEEHTDVVTITTVAGHVVAIADEAVIASPTPAPAAVAAPAAAPVVEVSASEDDAGDNGPLTAAELCAATGISEDQLASLEQYGVVAARGPGANGSYAPDTVAVVRVAGLLMQHGVDARHLRGWKQSAEREAALFEQLVTPLLRQRNPQSRKRAFDSLAELSELGGQLRAALMNAFVQGYSESN